MKERSAFILRLPKELAYRLTKLAEQLGLSRNQLIEQILKRGLEKKR